jgi:glutamine amidotransferase
MIAVLDYGIGNLRSAEKALQFVGADARLTTDPQAAKAASGVVLPGVGAFGACAAALRASGLDEAALAAIGDGRPVLAVCIGMQLLFDSSEESPGTRGLGVIPGVVRRLPEGVKRPQMQWNLVTPSRPDGDEVLGSAPEWYYFVHGYAAVPDDPSLISGTCEYGGMLTASVARDNLFATQFHPEKSGHAGLGLLERFARRCEAGAA